MSGKTLGVAVLAAALLSGCGGSDDPSAGFAVRPVDRPAKAAGLWYRPAPVDRQESQVTAEAGTDFFADACSEYLFDQAMHLRCQWITGPDRSSVVPLLGLAAPLDAQMRCHPLRDNPDGYRACLERIS